MVKYKGFEKANKVRFYGRKNDAKEREFLSFLTDFEGSIQHRLWLLMDLY
jgi:hypothetical protein